MSCEDTVHGSGFSTREKMMSCEDPGRGSDRLHRHNFYEKKMAREGTGHGCFAAHIA